MKRKGIKVNSLSSLMTNIKYFYPELNKYIFDEYQFSYTSLTKFTNQLGFGTYIQYKDIWKYIRDNEDLHEWWML